jgi:hypothetical protein
MFDVRRNPDSVLISFPMTAGLNEQLKGTFPDAKFDGERKIWVVPAPTEAAKAKVERFLPDFEKQVTAAAESFDNARAFVAKHDPATTPGLRVEAKSANLAVYTAEVNGKRVGVASVAAALKEIPGARWVPQWKGQDANTKQNVTRGGYWAVPMPKGADPTNHLIIAAGEMAKATREIAAVGQLPEHHPGYAVSTAIDAKGAHIVINLARDPNANDRIKEAGMKWSGDHGAYSMPLSQDNLDTTKALMGKLDSYMGSMPLQPTFTQTGLTSNVLEAAAKLTPESDRAMVGDFKKLIDGALSPTEQAAVVKATPADYQNATNDRIAAVTPDKFPALQTAVATIDRVANVQIDQRLALAQAELSRAAPAQNAAITR